jgi:hypothetical protein
MSDPTYSTKAQEFSYLIMNCFTGTQRDLKARPGKVTTARKRALESEMAASSDARLRSEVVPAAQPCCGALLVREKRSRPCSSRARQMTRSKTLRRPR